MYKPKATIRPLIRTFRPVADVRDDLRRVIQFSEPEMKVHQASAGERNQICASNRSSQPKQVLSSQKMRELGAAVDREELRCPGVINICYPRQLQDLCTPESSDMRGRGQRTCVDQIKFLLSVQQLCCADRGTDPTRMRKCLEPAGCGNRLHPVYQRRHGYVDNRFFYAIP